MGFFYEHPEGGLGTPQLQGQFRDSTYYLIPTDTLPLLRPLTVMPYLGPLLATILDPRRFWWRPATTGPSTPGADPGKYLYFPNPITAAVNFLAAIPTGWDNGIAYITGDPANWPFHTTAPGACGVGGPPVNAGAVDPTGLPLRWCRLRPPRRPRRHPPSRPPAPRPTAPGSRIESPTETVVPQGISSPQGIPTRVLGTRPIKTAAPAAASIGADRTQRPNRDRAQTPRRAAG